MGLHLQDWVLVAFGGVVSLTGGWIQLHPERVLPLPANRQLEPAVLAPIRRLGACFLFMGVFFALQMSFDLTRRPWWGGTLSGLVTAVAAVLMVDARIRRRQASEQVPVEKALEVR